MNSKISNALVVGLFALAVVPNAMGSGDKVGGGGNVCLLKLEALSEDVQKAADRLASLESAGISASDFKSTLAKARFQIGEHLTKADSPVDALNFPEESLIMVDKDTCGAALATLNDGMSLLVHETLGLLKMDDSGYKISRNVLNELSQIVVVNKAQPDWKFVCSIKRTHYSTDLLQRMGLKPGGSGNEVLAVLDTYGNEWVPSEYFYGRTDHDTDEYHIVLSVSRGIWYEHAPELTFSFQRDPGFDSIKREYPTGKKWNSVTFDQNGKATIPLLNGSAFSDSNSSMSMDCYRSI